MKKSDLLSQWKKRKGAGQGPAKIPPRPEGTPPRPAAGQRRLFLLQQLYPGNRFYQYGHRYDINGPLDTEILQQSFNWVMNRHEALRSSFIDDNGEVQVVLRETDRVHLSEYSVEQHTQEKQQTAAEQQEEAFLAQTFDLSQDRLVRGLLIRFAEDHHRLVLSMHHIIGDRGSLQVLEQQLFAHYEQLRSGAGTTAPLAIQYPDFAHWEGTRTVKESHFDYWRKQLAGELPVIALPHDYPRAAANTFRGANLRRTLPAETAAKLRNLARAHNTTLSTVVLAAYYAFLFRYTGQSDILIGSPVSTRDRAELEPLVGFFNETVVLRQQVDPEQPFSGLIDTVRPTMEAALAHKEVSFDWLVNELKPDRRGGISPFFQTMYVFNAEAPRRMLPGGLEVRDSMVDLDTAKFDLTLFATDYGKSDGLLLNFEYATDLFAPATMQAMLGHLTTIITSLADQPETSIGYAELLPTSEKEVLLEDWNRSFLEHIKMTAPPALLPELVRRNAETFSEAVAVTDGTHYLSWAKLFSLGASLAQQLLDQNLKPGEAVGLYCGRSPELLTGIVGIHLAGGAYVPIDPEYPKQRIDHIIGDCGARLMVHQHDLTPPLPPETAAVDIPVSPGSYDIADFPEIERQQAAYLIYTSGSTGRPKGIVISHDNLAHSTAARFQFYTQQPGVFLLLSSFAFDSSVAGIFWTLASGGTLVLSARRAEQDPAALGRLVQREKVTHTLLLPSLYQLLLEFATPESLSTLQTVMVAGEACPSALVEQHHRLLPNTVLVNEYGPTEGTVWSTAHRITRADSQGMVPIGRPIPGMGHYVLDARLQPLPINVAGELYLSGRQLAAGYHGQPALTAAAFQENPFVPGERLYGTGDLVRYRKNGLIDFLGRRDQQVKIRGHRIELTEISNVLEQFEGVRESVLTVRQEQGVPQLTAYYEGAADAAALKEQLRQQPPQYMVPATLVQMAAFPRLPNGKIDRRALPAPEVQQQEVQFVAPQGALEQQLAALWADVLGVETIGRNDNFFEIGGDSLKSIRIIAGAAKLGLKIAPHHLFNHQTIAELAPAIALEKEQPAPAGSAQYEAAVLLRKGGSKPPLFCLHSGGGHVFFYRDLALRMDGGRSVYAVQPKGLAGETDLPRSIEEMATDYISAIKKIQARGPYLLLGTCFSNAVAVEMAQQLVAGGDEVLPLIIVDSSTGTFGQPDTQLAGKNPLHSLLNLIREGRWDRVKRKIQDRAIVAYRRTISKVDEQKRNLYGTIDSLNKIHAAYNWKPYDGKVLLIRSTEFAGRQDKDYHLTNWRALATSVDIRVVEGNHLTLFEEPSAHELAQTIDQCVP